MSQDDLLIWDRRHALAGGAELPSSFLREIVDGEHWEVAPGRALDIACGKGGNALFLAERGFDVTAIDISPAALAEGQRRAREKSLTIAWQQTDLEQVRLPEDGFDLVINFNYLQRSLIPQLKAAVKSGGHMIFETFLIDQQAVGHPKNPDYLLAHNELLQQFPEFRVLWYREGKFAEGAEPSFRAGLFAQKGR